MQPSSIKRVDPMSQLALTQYISSEADAIKQRQTAVETEISELTKKLAGLKETFLVLSGALQGLDHVSGYLQKASVSDDDSTKLQAFGSADPPEPKSQTLHKPKLAMKTEK